MSVVLNPEKMMGFQKLMLEHIERVEDQFAGHEILFGLAELTGRLTASNTQTWVAARDTLVELCRHMERATITGVKVKYGTNQIIIPNQEH